MTTWQWQFDVTLQGRFTTEDPRDGEVDQKEMEKIAGECRQAAKLKLYELLEKPLDEFAAKHGLRWIDTEIEGEPKEAT